MIKCVVCFDIKTSKVNRNINNLLKQYGCRVQKSVYELCIEYNELDKVSQEIANIIDIDNDSCIIYNLGKIEKDVVINIGKDVNYASHIISDGYLVI